MALLAQLLPTGQTTTVAQHVERLQSHLAAVVPLLQQPTQTLTLQQHLDDATLELWLLLDKFNLHPEAALQRAIAKHNQQQNAPNVFKCYSDRVELWQGATYRGGWPLYSDADLDALEALALSMGYRLDKSTEPYQQLHLFNT
jgi:hypothetical protein